MTLASDLLSWYDCHQRTLPWRQNVSAYHTWVSEIMLQQTQVKTVIPYYHRFLELFPTVNDLAQAPEDTLMKAWEGLGYYSRVRNMQKAAQQIVEYGYFPSSYDELMTLSGIGPYTAGAIASIAFNEVVPAVDGNVLRIYTRLLEIADDISLQKTKNKIHDNVMATIDSQRPGDFNQALMDIGSQICTPKKPQCHDCPLQSYCQSYAHHTVLNYPYKKKKQKKQHKYYIAIALHHRASNRFSYIQRPDTGLLAKMYSFPLIEVTKEEYMSYHSLMDEQQNIVKEAASVYETKLNHYSESSIWQWRPLAEITHLFSHQKWHLIIAYGITQNYDNTQWLSLTQTTVPLSKVQQKLNDAVLKFCE